jgi:hypothetical protein
MSRRIDEMIGVLSSLCKVKSADIEENPTLYDTMQETIIFKIQNPHEIYQEHLIYCVAMKEGDYRIGWVLNDSVSECMICNEPFSLLVTRHHCRCCGCLTCDECCSQRVRILQLPGRKCRVCDVCGAKHIDGEEWDLTTTVLRETKETETKGENEQGIMKQQRSQGQVEVVNEKIELFSDV